ncbi:MAG: hypothetical protein ACYCSN_06085 [Acidobacteriaceae bacterium]
MNLLTSYCWAVAVACAFPGFGAALLCAVASRSDTSWAIRAGIGVSLFIAVSGWMNLGGWIRPHWLLPLIATGDIFFAIALFVRSKDTSQDNKQLPIRSTLAVAVQQF